MAEYLDWIRIIHSRIQTRMKQADTKYTIPAACLCIGRRTVLQIAADGLVTGADHLLAHPSRVV